MHDQLAGIDLSAVLENIADGLIQVDRDWRFRYVNQAGARLLERAAAELVGRSLWEFFPEARAHPAYAELERAMRAGEHVHLAGMVPALGKWLACDLYPHDGGLLIIARDVTAERLADEALRESEQRFRLLIEQAAEGIYGVDLDGRCTFINPAAARLLGYSPEELLGQRMHDAIHHTRADGSPYPIEECPIYRAFRTGDTVFVDDELLWRRDGTSFLAEYASKPTVRDGRVTGTVVTFRDITERRRAEDALRASERHLRRVIDSLYAFVGVMTPDGTLIEANRAALQAAGILPIDVLGRRFDETYWWNYDPAVQARLREAIARAARGEPVRYDVPVRVAGGRLITIDFMLAPMRDDSGQVTHLIPSGIDITERKRAEDALRESEERHRTLFTSMTQGVVYQDASGAIVAANPAAERILGLTLDQLQGRTSIDPRWRALREDGSDFPGEEHPAMAALRSGEPVRQVVMGVAHPGADDVRWILVNAVPLFRPGETRPWQVFATFEDITARRTAELALRATVEREARRSRQLRQLADASLEINAAPALATMLDAITIRAREIIGAHQAVTSVTSDDGWSQAITSVSLGERYADWRDYATPPDGSGIYRIVCQENRPLRLTQAELEAHPAWRGFGDETHAHPPMRGWLAVPLVGRDGRNLGLIQLSDKDEGEFSEDDEAILVQLAQLASVAIENARLIEGERAARAEAERAVGLRDHVLATVSHDLKTPLTSIKGNVQLLRRQLTRDGGPDLARFAARLDGIDETTTTMADMIEEILDAARLQMGQPLDLRPAPADLVAIVEQAVQLARAASRRDDLVIDARVTTLVGEWDEVRIGRVLGNLLSNAIKYSTPGSGVTVTIDREDGQARVAVQDHGVGIPVGDLPHVFDAFRRAGNVGGVAGTGVGLAGARAIVEQHGGTIAIASTEGAGTTVTVRLPLAGMPQPA